MRECLEKLESHSNQEKLQDVEFWYLVRNIAKYLLGE